MKLRLPVRPDGRTDEDKARALLMADAPIINEFNRRVAANLERRRIERLHKKWEGKVA